MSRKIVIAFILIFLPRLSLAFNAPPWICGLRLNGKKAVKFSAKLVKLPSGRSMYYERFDVKGAQKTFFLIHGATKNSRFFSEETPIVEMITARGYNVVAVDLHGNIGGRTPLQYGGKIPYRDNVEDVADLILKLNLQNVVLVGHSYGGFIALHTAGEERIKDRILGVYAASPYLQNLAVRVAYDYIGGCKRMGGWGDACDLVEDKMSGYMDDLEKRTDKVTRWLVEGLPKYKFPSVPNGIFMRILTGGRNSMLPDSMKNEKSLKEFLEDEDLDFNVCQEFIAQMRSAAGLLPPYREMLAKEPVHFDPRRVALVDGDYVDANRAAQASLEIEEQIFWKRGRGGHMWPAEHPENFVDLITGD